MAKTRSELTTVTPQMAENWLHHAIYERQRKRAAWHVKRLAIEMEKGRFTEGTTIHFGVLNGLPQLINGQHTLAAIVKSGVSLPLTTLYTNVKSDDDLAALYSRHDRHKARSPSDAFSAMQMGEKLGLSGGEINALGAALKFILFNFRRPSISIDPELAASSERIAEAMMEWSTPARSYFSFVREASHGMVSAYRRSPVVAVGLATCKFQPALAEEFWVGAAKDDGLAANDARKALNIFLMKTAARTGNSVLYLRTVVSAWNKFFSGEEALAALRPVDVGKSGVTIKGTDYKAEKPRGGAQLRIAEFAEDVAAAQQAEMAGAVQ